MGETKASMVFLKRDQYRPLSSTITSQSVFQQQQIDRAEDFLFLRA